MALSQVYQNIMGSFLSYLFTYVFGGITFIPLIVFLVWFKSLKVPQSVSGRTVADKNKSVNESIKRGEPKGYRDLMANEFFDKQNLGIKTIFSGWITVTKEFYRFPQINPDEFKQTATGDISLSSSTSGIQSEKLTSGIFSKMIKGHSHQNSMDEEIKDGEQDTAALGATKLKQIRKRNRFYGVIKHGNLFLYADENQKNVKYVIVLDHYTVAIWPRNLTDGQLYMRRSAICLINNDEYSQSKESALDLQHLLEDKSDNVLPPKNSYFLYGDLAIEKEDWYFALLKATSTGSNLNSFNSNIDPLHMAKPLYYNTADMMDLIGTLNATENQLTTKWLNAIIGRLFLSTYKTERFKKAFWLKIEERLKKIRTPEFLDQLQINRIDVGHSSPFFTNPKLKSLSPEGELEVTIDMLYQGGAMVEISTKLFLNVTGFKQRQFDIIVKLIAKKIQGEILLKIKPQPSSRIWYTYTKMPEMDITVEPVFSSRAVNYSIITGVLENKLRDAIKNSVVYPFFDDFVFFRSPDEIFRGGIFDHSVNEKSVSADNESVIQNDIGQSEVDTNASVHATDTNSEAEHRPEKKRLEVPISIVVNNSEEKDMSINTSDEPYTPTLETKTTSEVLEEDATHASEQLKDSVFKSYNKIKHWYKKGPVASDSTPASLNQNTVRKRATSSSKDPNYTPPDMISNRRRKPSKSDNLSIDIQSQQNTVSSGSSFQLLTSNVNPRPSGDAFIKLDRRRGSSQSSQLGSSSITEETYSSQLNNSPSSPDMFINEKFKSPTTSVSSNSNTNIIGYQSSSGSHMIPPQKLRYTSDTLSEPTQSPATASNIALSSGLQESPIILGKSNIPNSEHTAQVTRHKTRSRKPVPALPLMSPLPPLPPKDLDVSSKIEDHN